MRLQAAQTFHLDYEEMQGRHALTFDTYEIGKITLDEYLRRVVFYAPRPFSPEEFKAFMFEQSRAHTEMIAWICDLKSRHRLLTVAISNEGRELAIERIRRFRMKEFIDFFVCSGFVGLRKPDEALYRMALEMSQANPKEAIYLDDRPLLAEVGRQLGMRAIWHESFEKTKAVLELDLANL